MCDGTGRRNSLCTPCTIGGCSYNQYRPPCDGLFATADSVCQDCSIAACPIAGHVRPICDGTVATKDSQCTACRSSCSAGEYVESRCAPEGSTVLSGYICKPCIKSCKPGQRLSGACDGRGTADVRCIDCAPSCAAGEYMPVQCPGTTTQVMMTPSRRSFSKLLPANVILHPAWCF